MTYGIPITPRPIGAGVMREVRSNPIKMLEQTRPDEGDKPAMCQDAHEELNGSGDQTAMTPWDGGSSGMCGEAVMLAPSAAQTAAEQTSGVPPVYVPVALPYAVKF